MGPIPGNPHDGVYLFGPSIQASRMSSQTCLPPLAPPPVLHTREQRNPEMVMPNSGLYPGVQNPSCHFRQLCPHLGGIWSSAFPSFAPKISDTLGEKGGPFRQNLSLDGQRHEVAPIVRAIFLLPAAEVPQQGHDYYGTYHTFLGDYDSGLMDDQPSPHEELGAGIVFHNSTRPVPSQIPQRETLRIPAVLEGIHPALSMTVAAEPSPSYHSPVPGFLSSPSSRSRLDERRSRVILQARPSVLIVLSLSASHQDPWTTHYQLPTTIQHNI